MTASDNLDVLRFYDIFFVKLFSAWVELDINFCSFSIIMRLTFMANSFLQLVWEIYDIEDFQNDALAASKREQN